MKMCNNEKTVATRTWELVDMIRHRDGVKLRDLAEYAGVSVNTVCSDSKCPDNIPFGRMSKYLSFVGVDCEEMIKHATTVALVDK